MKIIVEKIILVCFIACVSVLSDAQVLHIIRGKVLDNNGEPLAGAGIVIQGNTRIGCITDSLGNFNLKYTDNRSHYFEVSFIGFISQKVKILKDKNYYQILLQQDTEQVSDVVITGYLDKKKEAYTGSVYSLNRQEIDQITKSNILNIIKLKVPGFEISEDIKNGSNPNRIPEMILRGRSSFIEGNETNVPLFILDGTEVSISYIFNLPTDDIESITVLKDASATSFYGSKAANGVVVIKTRPTEQGRMHLSYSGNYQLTFPDLSDYKLLNARDKLEYEKRAGIYGEFKGKSQDDVNRQIEYYSKLDRINSGINTDWKNESLRIGRNNIHNMFISGGSPQFRYNISASINSVLGVMQKSSKNNTSVRINLTYGSLSNFFMQNVAAFTIGNTQEVPYGKFSDYVRLNPYDSPYNEDGTLNKILSFNVANPIYEKNLKSYIKSNTIGVTDSFRLRWNISNTYRIESNISFTSTTISNENYFSPLSRRFIYSDPLKRGSFSVMDSKSYSLQANLFCVYNINFGKNEQNMLSMTLGLSANNNISDSHSFEALGVLSDKLVHPSMASGYSELSHPGGGESKSRMLGFYINANYMKSNKYFLDFSFRYEGSSKFGLGNKFAPFGALGFGWNIHRESWINPQVLSLLKVRASIGCVGNASFSPYQAQLAYRYSPSLLYNSNIGAVPVSMINPNLKWETSIQRNFGIDWGLYEGKLTGSVDLYYNTTNNLVMSISKPPHIGFDNAMENLGKIRNTGIELSFRGQVIRTSDFNFNLYLNASHNKNVIVHITDNLKNKNLENEKKSDRTIPPSLYQEGQSMTVLKVMKSAGINPANGREIYIMPNGEYTYKYDYRNKIVVGDTTPALYGSFGIDINWKNLNLAASFAYRLGATIYNQTLASKVEGGDPTINVDYRAFNSRWAFPGNDAKYKAVNIRQITRPTSRFVNKEYALDGSSIKLSWRYSRRLTQKFGLKQIILSISTGDIFNLSNVKRERGLDYPFARTFQLSINTNF